MHVNTFENTSLHGSVKPTGGNKNKNRELSNSNASFRQPETAFFTTFPPQPPIILPETLNHSIFPDFSSISFIRRVFLGKEGIHRIVIFINRVMKYKSYIYKISGTIFH